MVSADRLDFDGRDLRALAERGFSALRGRRLATIFQDPGGAFNPCKTIGWHIAYALRIAAPGRAHRLPCSTRSASPTRRGCCAPIPHQLSGGMLQRALIAMVVALRPRLIVADEPTTNLDNIVERQILALIAAALPRDRRRGAVHHP